MDGWMDGWMDGTRFGSGSESLEIDILPIELVRTLQVGIVVGDVGVPLLFRVFLLSFRFGFYFSFLAVLTVLIDFIHDLACHVFEKDGMWANLAYLCYTC